MMLTWSNMHLVVAWTAHVNPFSIEIVLMCVGHLSIAQQSTKRDAVGGGLITWYNSEFSLMWSDSFEMLQTHLLTYGGNSHTLQWYSILSRLNSARNSLVYRILRGITMPHATQAYGYSVVPMYSAWKKRLFSGFLRIDVDMGGHNNISPLKAHQVFHWNVIFPHCNIGWTPTFFQTVLIPIALCKCKLETVSGNVVNLCVAIIASSCLRR